MPPSTPDQAEVEPHVAVEDVAELVADHALQLVAGERLERAARDGDDGVAGRVAGGEGVDARLVVQHVDRRHGHAGGDRHLLDHVEQPALGRIAACRARQRRAPTMPRPPRRRRASCIDLAQAADRR